MSAYPLVYRTDTLLSVKDVSYEVGGKKILRDINVEIADLHRKDCVTGQIVAFLGLSGTGKTTLLRIIAGLLQPTTGSVSLTPQAIPVTPGAVGMVMQNNHLFDHRTIWENLVLAAKQPGVDSATAKGKALEMLDRFQLRGLRNSYPMQISGGQRQRIAICQQLLSSEHFLLMDEPFASLDPLNIELTCRLISEVANRDELNIIIIATHDIRAALTIADTVWLLGRDANKPGATVVSTYDLVSRGLCWQPGVEKTVTFQGAWREIMDRLEGL